MPIFLILSLLIQIAFAVHVIKTGRDRMWLWIILIFSMLGCIVYFFAEILPELRSSRTGRKATTRVFKTIDPQSELKRLTTNLEISDNVENRVKLAQECVAAELYEQAIELYSTALSGIYQDDPNIMLGLATALFLQGDYIKTKETLNRLIETNPKFKSPDGHLLFARTLEALQENEAALEEYEVVASYYSGYEAKCRYALLLKKQGQTEKAQSLFNEIIKRAKHLPKNVRKVQKQWIEIASQQLD